MMGGGGGMMGGRGGMNNGYGPGYMGGNQNQQALYPPIIQRVEPVIQQHRVIEHVRTPVPTPVPALEAPPPMTVSQPPMRPYVSRGQRSFTTHHSRYVSIGLYVSVHVSVYK